MKKMICEICESQRIKKEKGIFICQDCGTEYSLEDAKKLLKEIDDETEKMEATNNKTVITQENNKYKLLNQLILWEEYLINFCEFESDYESKELSKLGSKKEHWNIDYVKTYYSLGFNLFPLSEGMFELRLKHAFKRLESGLNITNPSENFAFKFYSKKKNTKSLPSIPSVIKNSFNTLKTSYIALDGSSYFTKYNKVFKGNGMNFWKGYDVKNMSLNQWIDECDLQILLSDADDDSIIDGLVYENKPKFFSSKDNWVPVLDLTPALKAIKNRYNSVFDEITPAYMEFLNTNLKEFYDERLELLADLIQMSSELEKEFFLPYEYREVSILNTLINMVYQGKAETWKELVNLFDTEVYRKTVVTELSLINDNLKKVNSNLINLGKSLEKIDHKLVDIDSNITSIGAKIEKSNELLLKIKKNTFGILWEEL